MARRLSLVDQRPSRAVLYVRVSAVMGRTGDDFLSPDLQINAMRDLARRRDLREVEVVQDIDVSGRTLSRAGVDRILELARDRQIDVVALYDLSRLGRNTGESLRTITELRDLGVSVVSTVEQIDDSPEGQFQLGLWLGLAQLYSDQVGRRWSQVHRHNAERGVMHGRMPIGYIRTGPRTIEVDPILGPAITETFRRFVRGESINSLARRLAAIRGRRVHPSMVSKLLSSEAYLGKVRLNGEILQGNHEPLIDETTFARAQRILDRPLPSRSTNGPHSLAGIVFCSSCGLVLWRRFSRGTAYLQCRTRRDYEAACPGVGTPRFEAVEQAVLDEIRDELLQLAADPARRADRGNRRAGAKSEATRLLRAIGRQEDLLAKAGRRALDEPGYEPVVRELRVELDGMREQLAAAHDAADAPTVRTTLATGQRLLDRWPDMTTPERNLALRALGIRVIVERGGRVTVAW